MIRVKAFGSTAPSCSRAGAFGQRQFPRVLGIERLESSSQRQEATFARAMSSRPLWAAWDGSSTAAMPNSPACPATQVQVVKPNSPGKPSEPSRRCCNGVGLIVQVARLEKGERLLIRGRHHLGWSWRPSAIAKKPRRFVAATTRNPQRRRKTAAGQRVDQCYRYRLGR